MRGPQVEEGGGGPPHVIGSGSWAITAGGASAGRFKEGIVYLYCMFLV